MKRILRPGLTAALFMMFLIGPSGWTETISDIEVFDVEIENASLALMGKLYAAAGAGPFPIVILLNGFPGNEPDVLGLGRKLAEAGFNALTFNYEGTYRSQGRMCMANAQRDIQAAFDFVRRRENAEMYRIDTARLVLGGWCFGGGMALGYAAGHPEATAVFSVAGNDHGEFMREYHRNPAFAKAIDEMFDSWTKPPFNVRFAEGGLPKEIAASGFDRLDPIFDLRASAPRLAEKRILLVGGWNDRQVTIDQYVLPFYRALEKAGATNVTITAFQDDHDFGDSRNPLARAVIDWLNSLPMSR